MANDADRVVSIQFDNKDFEKKVSSTIGSIGELNKSLNFDSAKKAISDLSGAAKSMDLSSMGAGVDTVTARFSALGAVGFSVINNLVTTAMSAGTSIAKGLSFDQVNAGLKEYEMNLNSIQTILANTKSKGTTLDEVNIALDELNKYSDLTIYNFADMTNAISKFTAAGVDMGTAVPAIKGVANLAAISGTNNVEAARAMGQLAQAVSSGSLRLRDWMSVDAAGMGGEVFKTHLMQTASAMGTIAKVPLGSTLKDWEKKNGSFRDSLESGWVTADVLTTSLKGLAGELSMDQLLAIGYTKEQALAVIELGKTGMAAATQVKTLSGLFDTVKQAIGSGWSETFKNIFGNFEEAKSTFTAWNTALSGIIGNSAKKRNDFLLLFKKFGGRDNIIDSINLSFIAVLGLIKAFKQAFRDVFPKKSLVDVLVMSQKIKAFAATLIMSTETAEKVKNVFRGVFAVFGIGFKIIGFVVGVLFKLGKALYNIVSGPTLTILSMLGNVFYAMFKGMSGIGNAVKNLDFFKTAITLIGFAVKVVGNQIRNGLSKIDLGFIDKFRFAWLKLKRAFSFAGGKGSTGPDSPSSILKLLGKTLRSLGDRTVNTILWLANGLAKLADVVASFAMHIDFAKMFDKLLSILGTVKNFFSGLFGGVESAGSAAASKAKTGFELLSKAGSRLAQVMGVVAGVTAKIAKVFAAVGLIVGKTLGDIWNIVIGQFKQAKFNNVVDLLNVGLFATLLTFIRKFMNNGVAGLLGGGKFMEKIQNVLDGLKGAIRSFSMSIQAKALLDIAKAIGILALSLALLSLIDSLRLSQSLVAVGVGLGLMIKTLNILVAASKDKTIDAKTVLGLAVSLMLIGAALFFYSSAVALLGRLDLETLAKGTGAVVVLLIAMAGAIRLLSGKSDKKDMTVGDDEIVSVLKQAFAMVLMAGAVKKLAQSVILLGSIHWIVLLQGMGAVIALLGGIFAMMYFLPENSATKIAGIFALSVGVRILADAIRVLGAMKLDEMLQGLAAIGALFLGFGLLSKVVNEKEIHSVGSGLIAMAASIGIIAIVIAFLGKMDPKTMQQGLDGIVSIMKSIFLMMAGLTLIDTISKNKSNPGEVLIQVAGAIIVLAVAIKIMAAIPLGAMIGAIAGIAVVLALIVAASWLLRPVIPTLLGFGQAMALMGVAAAGIGLMFLGIGLGIYFVAKSGQKAGEIFIDLINRFITIIPDFIMGIVTGLIMGWGAILDAARTWIPQIVELVVSLVIWLMKKLIEISPLIKDFITSMILIVVDVLKRSIPEIITLIVETIEALLSALRELIPEFIDFAIDMMEAFLDGIAAYLDVLIAAGVEILVSIIEGFTAAVEMIGGAIADFIVALIAEVGKGSLDIIEAGVSLVEDLLNALGNSVGRIAMAMGKFIVAVIDGLTAAIKLYMPRIEFAFGQFIAVLVDSVPGARWLADLLNINIPKVEVEADFILRKEKEAREDARALGQNAAQEVQKGIGDVGAIKVRFQALLEAGPDATILRSLHAGTLTVPVKPGVTTQTGVNGGTGGGSSTGTGDTNTTVLVTQTISSSKPLTAADMYKYKTSMWADIVNKTPALKNQS